MKLAYLVSQYPKVSHTFVRREIHGLERLGHEVRRISIRRTDSALVVDPADLAEREQTSVLLSRPARVVMAGIAEFIRSPRRASRALLAVISLVTLRAGGPVRHLAYFAEACLLRRELARLRVTHVHVHFGTNAATVAWLARMLGGPSYSIAFHGPDEFDAAHALALREKLADCAFATAISDFTAAQLRRWARPEDWARIHVIRCTVDESFARDATPLRSSSRTLVCVGRLTPQKCPLTLIEAFAEVARLRPDAQLVLAGDGELRAEVERACARHGVSERVRITGWIDETEVRRTLAQARCLVLPSSAEGLPVVIMEAFAMRRPVISTYVAGIPELVRPEENGWLVPAGDVDALSRAMLDALDADDARLERYGKEGARRVAQMHDVARECAALASLLEAVG